ncbi:hypothetical protein [uncultured Gemmiger sp.]|uniref:hypothetical protein n=1 Tax=uncultured Gemmiger sp. TaxID=1623490 RepID=UPI0025E4B64D|nr:hypothetical protein [uncultured Gemmiger sp.]
MPRPRFYGNDNFAGWFVGAAYMPPVAAVPAMQPNGQTPQASNARPYNLPEMGALRLKQKPKPAAKIRCKNCR